MGVGNPNISGPELDAKKLVGETGYFQIKFGMNGKQVMETIAQQVKNIPDCVETVVGIAGSGLSMLGVALGCKLYNKNVKTIHPVALSGYIDKKELISLRGTLVPATTINRSIASIPLIGNILIGKKVGE